MKWTSSETLVVATQHTKQISIDDLVVGMYIVGLDQSVRRESGI